MFYWLLFNCCDCLSILSFRFVIYFRLISQMDIMDISILI